MKYYYIKSLEKILKAAGDRKLILYKSDFLGEVIYQNILHMGKDIEYFVSHNDSLTSFHGKEVRDIRDLFFEKEEVYIIIFALSGHKEVYETLVHMGKYEFEKDFCIYDCGGYVAKFNAVDSLLGYNRFYDELWGFKIYGNRDTAKIKIMVLGGSHSDPGEGNFTSWPEFLYEKISERYNVVVYSGGMAGYSAIQEFLKFLRDGLELKPDILITFDGYTDAVHVSMEEYPFLHRYQYKFYDYIQERKPIAPSTMGMRNPNLLVHGLKSHLTDSENWISTIRKIYAVAKEFGICYHSFFQPMIPSGSAVIDESICQVSDEFFALNERYKLAYDNIPQYVHDCQNEIKKHSYITDLTNIFDNEEDVYYDFCHSTDKGNRIIMNHIYEKIENTLKEIDKSTTDA